MKKFLFITFLIFFLFSTWAAYAENTINRRGNAITISSIDSDWSWSDTFPNYARIKIVSIQFNGGAADDQCVIKNQLDTGPHIFDVTVADTYDQRYKLYMGTSLQPVLDYDAGTYSAGATVIFIIDLN